MANQYSAFDAPTLPPPSTDGTSLPPPAADPSAAAPVLPSAPTLPPPASAPTAPVQPSIPTQEVPAGGPSPSSPATTPRGRKRSFPVGWLVAAFALAVVGIAGYLVLSGGDEATGSAAERALDDPADVPSDDPSIAPSDDPSSPIVQTFDDAEQVVADINDNSQEAELLEQLGLDETGAPIPDDTMPASSTDVTVDAVLGDPDGYRFRWADPSGQDLDITVDVASGNFSVVASDGISFRRIDDVFYGQDGADGEWYQLASDPFGDVPVIGIDGLPGADEILPASAEAFVTTRDVMEASGITVVTVDEAAMVAADLDARNDWLRPWGLLDDTAASARTATVTFTTDVSGDIVTAVTIDAPSLGGPASFTLLDAYDAAAVIENPLSD